MLNEVRRRGEFIVSKILYNDLDSIQNVGPVLHSDNDGEYLKSELQHYLTAQGIVHQTTCTSTPPTKWSSKKEELTLARSCSS